ncbi:MAG: right-handed parallel beta-helix repeat-containing protein [Flavobacteriales bacterium]|nr:right-handed parallel beta-helix repeat-containing protein [Flavobacteriales bacterium]
MRFLNIRALLFVATALTAFTVRSATYYISPTGNDNNNGTSQATAWRTIDRANQLSSSFQPGDRILFQRGGEYRGKLSIMNSGAAGNLIQIGAYGSGAQPIISGSKAVTGWTQHSGSIWKAPITDALKYVYVNGVLQELARFPNTGWLRNDQGTSTSLTDSELTQPNGYWVGATALIRTTNWSYDTAYVTGFSNNTLTHTSTGNNLGTWQWGYYLRNKLELLDAAGEWYHDRAAGMLYLWCPNNANPNNVLVEASVTDFGVYVGWQRHHIKVEGLHMRHQHTASLRLSGTSDLEALNCTFTDTRQAIYSTGNNQHFHHLDVQRTYGTGIQLLDNNTVLEHCTLTNIAMVKGLGEQNMGYNGIGMNGSGITVRDNRLENIGYCGIAVANDALVERNLVINSMAILNDGAGITFDATDGAIIRDNVVRDLQGDIESSAIGWVNSIPICHGIYFGNVYNMNVLVKGNTVMNCRGAGLYVDHTMLATGNRIEDNVLVNNNMQLFLSDYSNYNGPGATAPFHVPTFNSIYSGNVLYCMTKDQLCVQQYHVYSANPVDFGTFTGNYYFNPYNDRSIYVRNSITGAHTYYTLERWQAEANEDPTGSRSLLRLPSMEVTQVLAASTVPNGNFGSNVNGWTGWPSQGQITHNNAQLDNGCLKLSFTSNATYNTHNLRHSATIGIQNGAWYRMKFSVVSDVMGEFTVGFKADSQADNPWRVGERVYAYDGERRDVEHIFQSDRTDNGSLMFTCHYSSGIYYLDNVSFERVQAVPVDPFDRHLVLINEEAAAQDFDLVGCWSDVDGNLHTGSVTLQPYGSIILIKESDEECLSTDTDDEAAGPATQGLRAYPNPAQRGESLVVETADEAPAALELRGMQGQLIWQGRASAGQTRIDIPAQLRAGAYLLIVEQSGERRQQRISVL